MTKKRKPRKRRIAREFRRPPNRDESMDIAMKIYGFAELLANGQPREAVDAIADWVGDGPVGALRTHYIAGVAPVMAMGLMRKNFPVDMAPEDLWIMEHADEPVEDPGMDVHREAVCQALVRYLNDDHETAQDITTAHLNAHGDEGLFWFSVEAVKLLAGIIRSVNELESGGDAA